MADDRPELLLPDAAAWRAWLLAHHSSVAGVWLVLHKKGGDVTTLTYADALDEALCFGWIDGQTRRRDAASTLQRMTPRRPQAARGACPADRRVRRQADAGRDAVPAEATARRRRLREPRPGAERIHTWNDEENAYMLSINVALGFAPTGVIGMWQKRLSG